MRKKIVVTNLVHGEVLDFLSKHATLEVNADREPWPNDEVARRTADADAILAFMTDRVDAAFLGRCPRLRIVACVLKGYDNFDVAACTSRGVWLSIVPDLLTAPTAELAVGLAIALGRKVLEGDDYVRSGRFRGWRPQLYGAGLDGSTVGIVGLGAVGKAIARRLTGFGARLLYNDPSPLPEPEAAALKVRFAAWQDLLAESDFLILAAPFTADSLHLVGPSALASIKPGCLLVNAGRGSVVDERAVAAALADGKLGGYAADVFEMEDWARSDRPRSIPQQLLMDRARTVFTPHLGSAVDRVRRDMAMAAARDVVDTLDGRRPANAVNRPLSLGEHVIG